MTFNEARTQRRTNLAMGGSGLVLGTLILLVTTLKGLYITADQQGGFGADNIKAAVVWIYKHGIVVSWLWPWMSDTGFGGTFNILFSPSAMLGWALFVVSAFLFRPKFAFQRMQNPFCTSSLRKFVLVADWTHGRRVWTI